MIVRFKFKAFVFSWIVFSTLISRILESSWVGWSICWRAITCTTPKSVGTNGRRRRRKTAGTHHEKNDSTKEARNRNKKLERTWRVGQRNARQDRNKKIGERIVKKFGKEENLGSRQVQTVPLKRLTLCCVFTKYTISVEGKIYKEGRAKPRLL